MKYQDLINTCIHIRSTWNPITMSLDAHAEEYLKKFSDDNERIFIKQIFFGTYRYEEFIKAFNTALFKRSPGETNRNDGPMYAIFVYLVCFRFDEFPFEEFKKLVNSQNPVKMHVLFQFLFNVELLKQHVRHDWCKLYDESYIDDVVLGGIEAHLPKMTDFLAQLSMKATGKVSDFVSSLGSSSLDKDIKSKTWRPTATEPFNLSSPKVKALPVPIKIPKIVKSNPVPEAIYATTLSKLQEDKKKRKEEIKEKLLKEYKEGKVQPFDLETEKRPLNIDKLVEEAEVQLQRDIEKINFTQPLPNFNTYHSEPKLNTAAILKEVATINRSKKDEEEYLKQVEMNMRDSSEFENWKKKVQTQDLMDKLEHQERKKVEMQLAREAAVKAVEEKTTQNRENVQNMKQLSQEYKKEIEAKEAEAFEYRKQLKDAVYEAKENAEKEKQRLLEENKKKHDNLTKEQKERWFMKLEEDEVELMKRKELISKIRELEKRPKDRNKQFDASETMGFGLLEEMSLAQLRERLEQVKKERLEDTEKKRIENVKHKEDKDADIKSKISEIQAARQQNAALQAEKRMQKQKEAEEERKRKQEFREKSLLEVHGKITQKKEDKKAELERIAKELREIKLKRQYMNADKAALEAKAWKSLEDGAEREILMRQNDRLMEQEGLDSIKLRERKILAHRATLEMETKLEQLREYDRYVEETRQHNEVLYREERETKQKIHQAIKEFQLAHQENMDTRDPFRSKISAMSLSKAKTLSNSSKQQISSREEIRLPPSKYTDLKQGGIIIEEKSENLES